MCIICRDLEAEVITDYDAMLLVVELRPFIGAEHSEFVLDYLKSKAKREAIVEPDETVGLAPNFPFDSDFYDLD